MNGKELHLGQIDLKELAEWFGISYGTMRNTKEKRLELLKVYADYHLVGKKIIIDKIMIPEFFKSYDIIDREFTKYWPNEKIDTNNQVGIEFYYDHPEIQAQISLGTCQNYVSRKKRNGFGLNNKEGGTLGYSISIWCKEIGEENIPLNKEEYRIFREVIKEKNKEADEKALIIEAEYRNGELTKEEYLNSLGSVSKVSFNVIMDEAFIRLGFMPKRKTKLIYYEEEQSAF